MCYYGLRTILKWNDFNAALTLKEYCEEEMWVWVFPNYKWQKSCQITSRRQVICKFFLESVIWKNPYSQFRSHSTYSHCTKLQISMHEVMSWGTKNVSELVLTHCEMSCIFSIYSKVLIMRGILINVYLGRNKSWKLINV